MATPDRQALTDHLLSRIEADLAFLASQHLLSGADLALIRSKLAPIRSAEQGMAALSVASATPPPQAGPQRTVPPPPPPASAGPATKPMCRAVWDYNQSQPDDLAFRAGDIIAIQEEVNADWWKGSLNGKTGLFPCNHVERTSSPTPSPVPHPPASGYSASYAPSQSSWVPPPPGAQQSFPYQQPQAYGSSTNSLVPHSAPYTGSEKNPYQAAGALPPPPQPQYGYQPPPAPPQQQVVAAAPDAPNKKNKYGKFGKQMGLAVAGGVGFGTGSALASEAVHAIF